MEILVNGNFIIFGIYLNQILNDRCYEYIQQCQNIPCVWYQINIKQSGKTSEFVFSPGHFTFLPYLRNEKGNSYLLTSLMNLFMLVQMMQLVMYYKY